MARILESIGFYFSAVYNYLVDSIIHFTVKITLTTLMLLLLATIYFIISISLTIHLIYYIGYVRGKKKVGSISPPNKIDRFPMVSIILPIKNEPISVLERLLSSLKKQSYPNNKFEVIIVSDDPKSNFLLIKNQLLSEFSDSLQLKFIHREIPIGGKAGALTIGAKKSSGEYIILLDADAVLDKQFIQNMVNFMEKNKDYVAGQAKIRILNENNSSFSNIVSYGWYYLDKTMFAGKHSLRGPVIALGSCSIFRRFILEEIGYWSNNVISDDLDISIKILKKGYRIGYISNAVAFLEVAENYGTFKMQNERWAYGSFQILLKRFRDILSGKMPWKWKLDLIFYLLQHQFNLVQLLFLPIFITSLILGRDIIPFSYTFSMLALTPAIGYSLTWIHNCKEEGASAIKGLKMLGASTAIYTTLLLTVAKSTIYALVGKRIKWVVTPKGESKPKITARIWWETFFGITLILMFIMLLLRGALWTSLSSLIFALPQLYITLKVLNLEW